MRYILILLLILLPLSANAESRRIDTKPEYHTNIIYGGFDGKEHLFGLEVTMQQGWKTYWRNPGDAGLPTEIIIDGAEHRVIFPSPTRFINKDDVETIGYKDNVIIPFFVKTTKDAINITANYGICDDLCMFGTGNANFTLSDARNNDYAKIGNALIPPTNRHIIIDDIRYHQGALHFTINDDIKDIFIDGGFDYRFPQPTIDGSQITAPIEYLSGTKEQLDAALKNNKQPFFMTIVAEDGTTTTQEFNINTINWQAAEQTTSIWYMILIALLGGLILNAMPCVLPVLGIKIMSVIKHGDSNSGQIRSSFAFSILGILTSFWILAGLVVYLKSIGSAVGWGMQFQQPIFIITLVVLLTLFVASMLGLIHISLPKFMGRLSNVGSGNSHASHFATGVMAALMATPCTAPIVGTAIGFALSGNALQIWAIFTALGLGLAIPYIAVMIIPSAVKIFPKPGNWMNLVKQIMGILLLITAIWLLFVLRDISGSYVAISMAVLMTIFLVIAGIKHSSFYKKLVMIAVIATSFILPRYATETIITDDSNIWQKLDTNNIPTLISQGKTVVIDITASWCLTCKYNKANVLTDAEVVEALSAPNIIAMRGDYTKPSEYIRDYLESHNRYGIPFNIIYSATHPNGLPLSEILDKETFLENIKN